MAAGEVSVCSACSASFPGRTCQSSTSWPLSLPVPHRCELFFEVFSQRYERGSILVTTNLPFDEWTEVFGSERLTGALLDGSPTTFTSWK